MEEVTRCELCGHSYDDGFRERWRHLKSEHPTYARALLFRIAAPLIFLPLVAVLAIAHAPEWAYLAALFATFALLFAGKQRARSERKQAGLRPTLPIKRLMREGGLGFIMIIPVIALLIVLLSRR